MAMYIFSFLWSPYWPDLLSSVANLSVKTLLSIDGDVVSIAWPPNGVPFFVLFSGMSKTSMYVLDSTQQLNTQCCSSFLFFPWQMQSFVAGMPYCTDKIVESQHICYSLFSTVPAASSTFMLPFRISLHLVSASVSARLCRLDTMGQEFGAESSACLLCDSCRLC